MDRWQQEWIDMIQQVIDDASESLKASVEQNACYAEMAAESNLSLAEIALKAKDEPDKRTALTMVKNEFQRLAATSLAISMRLALDIDGLSDAPEVK